MKIESRKKTTEKLKAPENRIDDKLMEPGSYEVTKNHTFDVVVKLIQNNERWVVVDSGGSHSHKLVFRLWNYDEMVELKKKATSYDQLRRIHMVDQDALNRLKVQKLLKSWTFGDENPRLKIQRVQGVLSDESWVNFKKLQANIITYILGKMNDVLDYNG